MNGLRACAVLPVILFHAGFESFSGGYVGVDVFFVISGYLITSLIMRERQAGQFSFVSFFERRARRILPALYLVLIASCVFAYAFMMPAELRSFSRSVVSVVLFSSNFFFNLNRNYFDDDSELYPLLHTWSLSAEEQFYFTFPFVLIFLMRSRQKVAFLSLFLLGLLSLFVAQAGGNFSLSPPFISLDWSWWRVPSWGFFLLPARAWELLVGSAIAMHEHHSASHRSVGACFHDQILSSVGLALVFLAVFAFDKETPFPSMYTLVPTLGAGLVIAFARQGTLVHAILSWRILVWIGLISYSLYLWHQPLFAFARITSLDDPGQWRLGALGLVAVGLAYLTWAFVEQPFRRARTTSKRPVAFFGLGVSIFLLVTAFIGIQTKGLSARLPKDVQAILAFRDYQHDLASRALVCFLKPADSFDQFPPQCASSGGASSMFLWGDSHAAAIGVGLVESGANLSQYAAASCPPILDFEWKKNIHCREINRGVLQKIEKLKPDVVVLHANWLQYDAAIVDLSRIEQTLDAIKNVSPSSRLVIVGGVPQWLPNLPNVIAAQVMLGAPYNAAVRVKSALQSKIIADDEKLAYSAHRSGARFVSLIERLCDNQGCRAAYDLDGVVEPAAYDYGHLTRSGSVAIGRLITLELLRKNSD